MRVTGGREVGANYMSRVGGDRGVGETETGTPGGSALQVVGPVASTSLNPSGGELGVSLTGLPGGRCMDIGRGGAP